MNAGVAAGHPATAAAGVEILAEGGSAADAAVAAALASCVAETVMTGLLGGGHAIYYEAASAVARNLDCFCAVPGLGAAAREPDLVRLQVPFGAELVHYAIGPASCAVPGVPAGLGALWESHGRLPWARLVEPALALARDGVPMPAAHVACLRMLEPVMTLREGAGIYAPGGALLGEGEILRQPGLAGALESLADEGAHGAYDGTIGRALLDLCRERGGLVTSDDLRAYSPAWSRPVETPWLDRRFLTRAGLSRVPETLARLPSLRGLSGSRRVVELVDRLGVETGPETHTTNLVAADADGDVCVLTTSLGLGSGDWLPGLDIHLNSMLGEADLIHGPLEPGSRMESMMAPSLVLGGARVELALGAAGGTRLRTALLTVALGILDEGLAPQDAVDRPRLHPAGELVNAEPGVDEDGLAELESRGFRVRRWAERHHYFGGVSVIGAAGAAADPRRSGLALPSPAAG